MALRSLNRWEVTQRDSLDIKCQELFAIVEKQLILCVHLHWKKTFSAARTAPPYPLLRQSTPHHSLTSLHLESQLKFYVTTSSQRLFPNIKLKTVTIRVWRLRLLIHVLFPLSPSHRWLFLVKRCLSHVSLEVLTVFFVDCWLQMPWLMRY